MRTTGGPRTAEGQEVKICRKLHQTVSITYKNKPGCTLTYGVSSDPLRIECASISDNKILAKRVLLTPEMMDGLQVLVNGVTHRVYSDTDDL